MELISTFNRKRVLITGHTGFKGAWLSIWLLSLGAEVHGLALDPPTNPSLYNSADLKKKISSKIIDIRDLTKVSNLVNEIKPDFIFHLAAQPLVKESYLRPVETWSTNVMGTVNVLESLRLSNHKCITILITSDKCYDNLEWCWGYRETDKMGGPDPYSGSKGAAELAISSFYRSFFKDQNTKVLIASARAGNVIGGGDWAQNRIVPDCIRAWTKNCEVTLRNPNSTRPWQHVLEPLSGYLRIAQLLSKRPDLKGESFNFGPQSNQEYTVLDVVKDLSILWPNASWDIKEFKDESCKESNLLRLNCDKALTQLDWSPALTFNQTIEFTRSWYYDFYNAIDNINLYDLCKKQILSYSDISRERGNKWI